MDRSGQIGCALVAAANSCSLTTFCLALARIDASVAHMIFVLCSTAAVLLLTLRREVRTTPRSLVRLGLGAAGVYLLIRVSGDVDPGGAGLFVVAAVTYTLHLTLIQWWLSRYPWDTVALYVTTFIAPYVVLVLVTLSALWERLSPVAWGAAVTTSLVSTVLAGLLLFAGSGRIGSGQATLLCPADMKSTVLWAGMFLRERLSLFQWLGGLLNVVSVLSAPHARVVRLGLLRTRQSKVH